MTHPIIKIGVNVFLIRGGKLLLGKRHNTAGAGDWGLPGGHLEFGESPVAGAKRELMEETGISALELQYLNTINDARPDAHYIHIGFLARGSAGEAEIKEPEKCSAWDWFDLNQLPKNLFTGHIKQINAFLNKQSFTD